MSNQAITYVWTQYKQGGAKKLLYLALADFANDTGECWPGIPTLAAMCNVVERHIQKLLRQLEAEGEINIRLQAGCQTGHGSTNRYILTKYIAARDVSEDTARGERRFTAMSGNEVSHGSPLSHRTSQGVNGDSPQGVNGNSPKPLLEPLKEPPRNINTPGVDGPWVSPVPDNGVNNFVPKVEQKYAGNDEPATPDTPRRIDAPQANPTPGPSPQAERGDVQAQPACYRIIAANGLTVGRVWDSARSQLELQLDRATRSECLPHLQLVDYVADGRRFVFEVATPRAHWLAQRCERQFKKLLAVAMGSFDLETVQVEFRCVAAESPLARFLNSEAKP